MQCTTTRAAADSRTRLALRSTATATIAALTLSSAGAVFAGAEFKLGDNVGGQVDGKAWLAGLGWLIPSVVGWGQFQPFVRWQKFERSLSDTNNEAIDVGVNYIIKGSNAKISAMFTRFKDSRLPSAIRDANQFLVGAQLQY